MSAPRLVCEKSHASRERRLGPRELALELLSPRGVVVAVVATLESGHAHVAMALIRDVHVVVACNVLHRLLERATHGVNDSLARRVAARVACYARGRGVVRRCVLHGELIGLCQG